MARDRKQRIVKLLKGIESGDPEAASVVNEAKYIQHNPQTHEGSLGLAELFRQLAKTNPRVNILRIFEDDDFVFAHTEYDFAESNVGFEIFRFEGDQAVEHWDNIQHRQPPNHLGHSMVDGHTGAAAGASTEASRERVTAFVEAVLIRGDEPADGYMDTCRYIEHSAYLPAGQACFLPADKGSRYLHCHRILADGAYVLSVCEGRREEAVCSFFDLYRLEAGLIVEHWDTREVVPPRSEWKNDNGKF